MYLTTKAIIKNSRYKYQLTVSLIGTDVCIRTWNDSGWTNWIKL